MVVRGLERYGYEDLAREIALNHLSSVVEVFRETGTIWENYAPQKIAPGRPAKKDFVGWSGIAPIAFFIEYAIGLRADARTNFVVWTIRSRQRVGVERFRFGGTTATLLCEAPDAEGKRRLRVRSDRAFHLQVVVGEVSLEVSVPERSELSVLLGGGS
jgi:hypothetical protein